MAPNSQKDVKYEAGRQGQHFLLPPIPGTLLSSKAAMRILAGYLQPSCAEYASAFQAVNSV